MSRPTMVGGPGGSTSLLVGPRSAGGPRFLDIRRGFGRAPLPTPRFGRGLTSSTARHTPIRSPVSVPSPGQVSTQDRTQRGQPAPLDRNGQPAPGHALPAYGEDKPGEEGRAHGPVPQPVRARASSTKVNTENATESPLGSGEGPGIEGGAER